MYCNMYCNMGLLYCNILQYAFWCIDATLLPTVIALPVLLYRLKRASLTCFAYHVYVSPVQI